MTDYMFKMAVELLPPTHGPVSYVDLGSGTGGAAVRLLSMHDASEIAKATCLNLCPEQNALANSSAEHKKVADRIEVVTSTYDDPPFEENSFDFCFSQDAFVHSFSKCETYRQALRITKPGGVFVFCDLMCGTGPDVSDEELATFAQTNMVNDWLSPAKNVKACQKAGWTDVTFIDLTSDIRVSFQLMLRKVQTLKKDGKHGIDPVLLDTYEKNLGNRVIQVDRGVFQWGVIHARKPSV